MPDVILSLFPGTPMAMLVLALAACGGPQAGSGTAATDTATGSMASHFVYVGTTTDDPANGVHVLRFDPRDGSLARAAPPVAPVLNPSFLAVAPDGRILYAVSETEPGEIVAFRRDRETGGLTEIDRAPSGGAGPAYVSVDGSGRWLAAANYGGGSVALLPVEPGGSLGDPVDVVQHAGSGPDRERQEAPHAHYARFSPEDRWLYVADLGIDRVIAYPLAGGDEGLAEDRAVVTATAPGAGPRHLAFHPDRPFAYLVNELTGTVTAYRYHAGSGRLEEVQTLSALPDDFAGVNKSADIHVHPDGQWLYASNRGDFDSIARFAIDATTGRLTPRGHQTEGIVWPRNFAIDPTGAWLIVANQHADEVRVFAVDSRTGVLEATPNRVEVSGPTNVVLVRPNAYDAPATPGGP